MNWAAIFWLALLALFLIMEAATVTMVSLWFAVGSLAAFLVSLVTSAWWLQIAVFLAISSIMLALLRPMVRRHLTPKAAATNLDAVVGSTGLVTADIDNLTASGQVKLGAMEWTARSTSGEPIPRGQQVRVDRIEGVKVFVSPVPIPSRVK